MLHDWSGLHYVGGLRKPNHHQTSMCPPASTPRIDITHSHREAHGAGVDKDAAALAVVQLDVASLGLHLHRAAMDLNKLGRGRLHMRQTNVRTVVYVQGYV
eukprot:29737-Chlamydomonas_euryale.AAC.1